MSRFILKSRRLDTGRESERGELFGSREQAQAEAVVRNCKPFTPFFWFVVDAPYFYRPLPGYNGKVLKCAGIATEENVIWFTSENPGTVIAPRYLGDRINADTFTEVEG